MLESREKLCQLKVKIFYFFVLFLEYLRFCIYLFLEPVIKYSRVIDDWISTEDEVIVVIEHCSVLRYDIEQVNSR